MSVPKHVLTTWVDINTSKFRPHGFNTCVYFPERANQEMYTLAVNKFALPGESDFPLNAFFEKPKSNSEKEELRKYFTQIRSEVGARLVKTKTKTLRLNYIIILIVVSFRLQGSSIR